MGPMNVEAALRPARVAPMAPQMCRVAEAWQEAEDVVSLRLVAPDGYGSRIEPGQFNMLYAFGVGEAAISLSGDPARREELLHTIRPVGRVSAALTRLKAGDMVGVRGPFGTGWPVDSEKKRHLLLVAGGLGLAPLRPAIYRALAHQRSYAGLGLVVGARSPRALLYPYQLAGWVSGGALGMSLTVDHAGPDWTGSVGVVTQELAKALDGVDPSSVSAFVCGPEVMMRHTCATLSGLGVPEDRTWVSMERNMKCAVGHCGHCQFGPDFVCRDGPVFRYDTVAERMMLREV